MSAFHEPSTGPKTWQDASEPRFGSLSFNPAPAPSVPEPEASRLAHTIEQEVIPRLLLSTRPSPMRGTQAATCPPPSAEEVAEYARHLIARDGADAVVFLATIEARGMDAESLYLDMLAPTARQLGDLWDQDLCDFTQVTVGLSRLQQVLRRLSSDFQGDLVRTDLAKRILMLPVPGEQHTFGLVMVCEFFRRAGWDVWGGPQRSSEDTVDLVAAVGFQVIGFSVGSISTLDRLASAIRQVRRRSCNPAIGVMVGGPIFLAQPELVARVGADATATDARHAVQQADALATMRQLRA